MVDSRLYTTRRYGIILALCDVLKTIDGTGEFLSNLDSNVHPTLKFWDEIEEYPAVHISSGTEYREYQGGGYADRYLSVSIKIYVEEENSPLGLDLIIEDIETVLEENSALAYYDKRGVKQCVHQISISTIVTDEGILDPAGMADISILIHY
jgi:hypothetical protein